MDAPLVSVVTIFFEAERFLDEAIESVLAQRYDNWELVLVDDGSTDSGSALAARHAAADARIRVVTHPGGENRGMSASRNLGVAHSTGELVAFLDADDLWLPDKLEEQVAILAELPQVGMLYGRTEWHYSWTGDPGDARRDFIHDPGVPLDTPIGPPSLAQGLLEDGAVPPYTCSVIVRRAAFDRLGGFEEEFRGLYEDQVFFAKVFSNETVYVANRCWDRYRQHEGSACAVAYATGEVRAADDNPSRGAFLEWMAGYAARALPTEAALAEALSDALQPYRFPTAPWQVDSIARIEAPELFGSNIDIPAAGSTTGGYAIPLIGWAIGRSEPVIAVEVRSGGAVNRAPVRERRPDLGTAFPDVPGADEAGFSTRIAAATVSSLELEVCAVLRNQARVPFATIAAHRLSNAASATAAALVSVVVAGLGEPASLEATLASVVEQTYPEVEIVVVLDRFADESRTVARRYPGVRIVDHVAAGPVAAHQAGLAASKGAFVAFLESGDVLSPDAVEGNLTSLTASPDRLWAQGTNGHEERALSAVLFHRFALAGREPDVALAAGGAGIRHDRKVLARRTGTTATDTLPAAVLMYHRIADLQADPWGLAVHPDRFCEQLGALRATCEPMPLADLVAAIETGEVPERAVAITFDDGYEDNLSEALPLLQRFGLPATVFLALGAIDSPDELWWDELERLLLRPGVLPDRAEIAVDGAVRVLELGSAAEYREEQAVEHRNWRASEPPPTERHAEFLRLYGLLKQLPAPIRDAALESLRSGLGAEAGARASHRTLRGEQVLALADSGLVEIGAHTITHPRLAALDVAEQHHEIVAGKARLEQLLERPVHGFAYPHGTRADYGPDAIELVRFAGFEYACAAEGSRLARTPARYELPRFQILDWSGEQLAGRLDALLSG